MSDGTGVAIGRCAVRALHAELVLFPKPGLVSPVDSGAHDDMTAVTFLHSLFALRRYFIEMAVAGGEGADFGALQRMGVAAERRMLAATRGANTHRGAIFSMGLLAAAAGWHRRHGGDLRPPGLARTVVERWGRGIAAAGPGAVDSHGSHALRRYGGRGARDEALEGFPTLVGIVHPSIGDVLDRLGCPERAMIQGLFAAMAALDDTNLLHRGGTEGLAFVRGEAQRFLEAGGVFAEDWRPRALALHRACVARRLSPGGSADMVAAGWFLHLLEIG